MRTRKAILPDAPEIHRMISEYTSDGTLLPRTLQEICENVRDFIVVEDRGKVIACAALHFYGLSLAEVRSVTVDKNVQGRNVGRKLVEGLIAESENHRIDRLFLFTRVPDFFSKLGFVTVPHQILPEKVHKDCVVCPRRDNCDEIAMVWGVAEAEYAMASHDENRSHAYSENPLRVLNAR
jgi:N-acetylglutamate synthase-like GNAT family acetyltransferase